MIILKTLKGITKLSISGSAISGVLLIDLEPKDIPRNQDKVLLEKIKSNTAKFTSIQDVVLYEKATGCSFVFSDSGKLEKLYTGEEFLKKIKEQVPGTTLSERSIFEWAETGKTHCNSGAVTVFRNGNDLRLGTPDGGWST